MKKIVTPVFLTILAALCTLLLVAAAYRAVQMIPYPMGAGRCKESPDKRFKAHASSMTDCEFFSGERHYYEFSIEAESRRTMRRLEMDAPAKKTIDWREEGTIEWATDSSTVTYSFKGTQLILTNTP
jgi:hypothetical protein